MNDDLKKIIHVEISEPLNKIVGIFTEKPKKSNLKIITFWIIIGLLAFLLLYYAYEMLYACF
ncbi:hypothetical protein LL037_19315 [Clostridium estertheticum]|uniref:Uncharacterized protein n=1 Tax=Clostridium estertheticum TaxID=238834 RepID=A0AA47ELQ6_9CLOT|nr:hypothetical protein [Clostridium estertheticum]MBU3153866.1 hypothetical protein [Clostridium estertheticum]MBU3198617.1 hypothetical protein [Clostridium estertheticum]WAG61356.1 hypothetical protein LL038_03635 [Clostridium estertheticum]WAG64594.1 hypothetical protein LL037_19315 [Clostridium estertheticum]